MPQRVLVIDDEAHILQVLSLKLRKAGYDVLMARDGEEGFEVASSSLPDLVITDFQMPYMTGLELCRALAKDAATASIPVLMLTARGYALDAEDLAIGNIRDVLSKPFSPRAIVQQVQDILSSQSSGVSDQRSEMSHSETSDRHSASDVGSLGRQGGGHVGGGRAGGGRAGGHGVGRALASGEEAEAA